MKKIIYIIAAFAASVLAISSCSKENAFQPANPCVGDGTLVEKTFYAESESVKANVSGLSIIWANGDNIGISTGSGIQKFTISEGSGTGKALFTGTIGEADKYYAIYPYNKPGSTNINEMNTAGVFTTQFNTWYNSANAGALLYNPACAVSTDGNSFQFKTLGAILKFTVPEDMASKLTRFEIGSSNSDEKLFGAVTVDLTGDSPVLSAAASTLCTFAKPLAAGTYYIGCAPATLTKGFYMRFIFTDGTNSYYGYKGKGGTIALASNKIYDLGTINDSDEIVFTEFNNGVTTCIGNVGVAYAKVDCSTVKEGSTGSCIKFSAKGSGSSGGKCQFDLSASKADALKVFPVKVRKAFTRTRIRIYLGENEWYPTVTYTPTGKSFTRLPSSINGVSLATWSTKNCTDLSDSEVSAFKAAWSAAVSTDGWNELEWNMEDWDSTVNWNSNNYLNFQFFTTPKGANSSVKFGDSIYLDNIRFAVSDTARKIKQAAL